MPETERSVFKTLVEAGCCKRCTLRFISDTTSDHYNEPETVLTKLATQAGEDFEQVSKKIKLNPCAVCLDLLQDEVLDSLVNSPDVEKALEYDCATFVNFISFPTAVLLREHSMEVYMKEKHPQFYEDHPVIAINRAWSFSMQNRLAKKMKKKYDKSSVFLIRFGTTYDLEKEESSAMFEIEKSFKKLCRKDESLSRNVIGESLKTVDNQLFCKHVPVPPEIPTKAITLESVTFTHEAIYIAGRYCKYSRNLGQTPWVIGKKKIVENSVQEIIFEAMENVFNCKQLVFSSSGREDFDVRTLGRGRPFFVKICDPKITTLPFETFRTIEKEIKKSQMVEVKHLQFVDRKLLSNIKDGEQFKQKSYRALCIVNKPENLTGYIECINKLKTLVLNQKTPIRVYHRRSSDGRKKEIYSIEAKEVPGRNNLFELDLMTQAGTYVKEFVHGDLGRTKPSLKEILGGHVDIVTLDVMDIHLDFPPPINYDDNK